MNRRVFEFGTVLSEDEINLRTSVCSRNLYCNSSSEYPFLF